MRSEKSAAASARPPPPARGPSRQRRPPGGVAPPAERGKGPAEGIRNVLARALEANGLQARVQRQLPIHVWAAAVGPEIAQRARPVLLRNGELHLVVQDHRWRDQLDAARGLLIARINEKLGCSAVHTLRFGPAPDRWAEECRPVQVAHQLSAALPARCEDAQRLVGDLPLCPEVREALLAAASAAVRRGRAPT